MTLIFKPKFVCVAEIKSDMQTYSFLKWFTLFHSFNKIPYKKV